MPSIDFTTPQAAFIYAHPSALDAEECKQTDAAWPVYSCPSQWVYAEPSFQMPIMLQPASWQLYMEQGAQLGDMCYSSDLAQQSGNAWMPSVPYAEVSQQMYGQLEMQGLQPMACAQALQGNVWTLSRDGQGCRQVQDALEEAASDKERITLAAELHTHVQEAIQCPNANHVIQKCIGKLPPLQSQFIINEISGTAGQVARHKYGCRILQRLIEHCSEGQIASLLDELLGEAAELSTDIYGSYVMKHILEHGFERHISTLTYILAERVPDVSRHSYGSAVLGEALAQASGDSQLVLAKTLLLQPAVLRHMAHSRHGHATVKLALQVAEAALPTERQAALSALRCQRAELAETRYGRALNQHLMQLS